MHRCRPWGIWQVIWFGIICQMKQLEEQFCDFSYHLIACYSFDIHILPILWENTSKWNCLSYWYKNLQSWSPWHMVGGKAYMSHWSCKPYKLCKLELQYFWYGHHLFQKGCNVSPKSNMIIKMLKYLNLL